MSNLSITPTIAATIACYLGNEPECQEFERLIPAIANSREYVSHLVSHKGKLSSLSVEQVNSLPCIGEKIRGAVSQVLSSCAQREIASAHARRIPEALHQTTLFKIRSDLRDQIFHLDLSDSNVTDADLDILSREMPHLTQLNLGRNNQITNQGIRYVARLQRLQSLDLMSCEGISYDEAIPPIFNNCPDLEVLRLDRTDDEMTNEDLLPIAERDRPKLLSLGLSGHSSISDGAILAIASRCPNLQELVTNCGLTGATIRSLAGHCPNLQVLDISHSTADETDIRFLLEHCQHLRKLSCEGMDEIDYDPIRADYPNLELTEA